MTVSTFLTGTTDVAGRFPVRVLRVMPDGATTVVGWPLVAGGTEVQRRYVRTLWVLGVRQVPLGGGLCVWVPRAGVSAVNFRASSIARARGCAETVYGPAVFAAGEAGLAARSLSDGQVAELRRLSARRVRDRAC